MEFDFMSSLCKSLVNMKVAKDDLNESVEMLEKAHLQVSDIHPGLWAFVTKVLRGSSVRSLGD